MKAPQMIEPKELELKNQAGVVKTFIITKFPAVAGREIVTQYPVSNIPKIGTYQQSEEVMLKLMSYVAVVTAAGTPQLLTTRALVDNHCGDWEILARLEWAQLEYNCSFFKEGLISGFSKSISPKAVKWVTKMLTDLSDASSQTAKPPSTN